MSVTNENFLYIIGQLKDKSGIIISEEKMYLIESRLTPLARSMGLEGIDGLISKARMDRQTMSEIVDAMTTNETSFFRDISPFDKLRDIIIPNVVGKSLSPKLRIWSAAASTGQESYSVAMTVKENESSLNGKQVEIVGTDINNKVLDRAREGLYSQFEIQRGLPISHLMKYFKQLESYGEKWQVNDELKNMTKFQCLNLLDSYSSMGDFDIIFCRNVLIYFEKDVKRQIIKKLVSCLKPNGFLMLGSSESINDLTDELVTFDGNIGVYCHK